MKFRTEFQPISVPGFLNPEKPVVLIGSCFSQNMGAKMSEHQWKAEIPAGTLYNPYSIAMALELMNDEEDGLKIFENSLFQFQEIWHSIYFDSSFSSKYKEDCLEDFRIRSKKLRENLEMGSQLIVTFGTSICYKEIDKKQIVGNCHKLPASKFDSFRMTPNEISELWRDLLCSLRNKFSDLKVVFTVSPVRHLKDGFVGNALSKAVLQLAVEEICRKNIDCQYFPAYEILNDDLRDYRFYASDLCHPSNEAIEYIWEKFLDTYIDPSGRQFLADGLRVTKLANHRPKLGALGRSLSYE